MGGGGRELPAATVMVGGMAMVVVGNCLLLQSWVVGVVGNCLLLQSWGGVVGNCLLLQSWGGWGW